MYLVWVMQLCIDDFWCWFVWIELNVWYQVEDGIECVVDFGFGDELVDVYVWIKIEIE